MSRPYDRVSADVRWAMTGARIRELLVDAGTRVSELKEELEQSTGTPARFLDLICDGAVLPDDACASYSFARSGHVELLVLRKKEPPRLLDFLLSAELGEGETRETQPAKQRDLNEAKYIEAKYIVEASAFMLNERDVRREEEEEGLSLCFWDCFDQCTPLHYGAAVGQAFVCQALLDHPAFRSADALADVGVPPGCYCCSAELEGAESVTALHTAILWHHKEICSLLLNHSRFTAVATANAAGQTALHLAVLGMSAEMVQMVLADGRVDFNAHTNEGHTALRLALQQRQFPCMSVGKSDRIIAVLLEHGSSSDCGDVLEAAVEHKDTRLVHVAVRCRHGIEQMLLGVLVGKGHPNIGLLFSEPESTKEARSRKRFLNKQRKDRTLARRLQSPNAKQAVRRPSKSRNSWMHTEFDFSFCPGSP
ncbi:ANK3 [Symbiodinium sp. CCMP2592]|nr:ANK3 [Symbiodinium sp. CCMP2592]